LAFIGCEEETVEPDAIPMTIEEVADTPGYLWVWDVLTTYKGDTVLKPQIGQLLDTNRDKFLVFTRAACSCPTEKREFAYIVKILRDLKYPESKYELFAMTARSNNHPYMNMFTLNDLPAIIYMRNGVPYYSLLDTMKYNVSKLIKYPVFIEELMMEALKKK
jgi:hypothetical protein